VHGVVAALVAGDVDRAMDSGLLDCPTCSACAAACTDALLVAREARTTALAARERYRARNARLQRRATELAVKRGTAPATDTRQQTGAPTPTASRPALPAAAAMALARAKARAGERHKP
jgi:Na+-translocating ferredoxin:NAD+ oxidoreductase RnfC subunit